MRKEEREKQREKGKDGGRGGRNCLRRPDKRGIFFFILKRGKVNSRTKRRKGKQHN